MIIFSNLTNKSNKIQSIQKSDSIKSVSCTHFQLAHVFFRQNNVLHTIFIGSWKNASFFYFIFFYHNSTIFFAPSLTPRETEACDIMG